jgi:hypothetical protein
MHPVTVLVSTLESISTYSSSSDTLMINFDAWLSDAHRLNRLESARLASFQGSFLTLVSAKLEMMLP